MDSGFKALLDMGLGDVVLCKGGILSFWGGILT